VDHKLEELASERTLLLDSSFLQPPGESFNEALYYREGMNPRRIPEITEALDCIKEVDLLLPQHEVKMTSEALSEAMEFKRILNEHDRYFGQAQETGRYELSRREQKNLKKREVPWDHANDETLALLGTYVTRFHKLLRRLNGRDPREKFTDNQKKVYEFILEKAKSRFGDIERGHKRIKEHLAHSVQVGEVLQTDQRIIATSYAIAFSGRDVLVLTRAPGLVELARRMEGYLGDNKFVKEHFENKITFYGMEPGRVRPIAPTLATS